MSCKKYLHLLVSLLIIFSSRSVQSGEWSYHIHDHLGNTRVVLDKDGDVKEYYDYYPFGKTLRAQVSGNETIYKFAGKELDGEDDLNWYYFGARYYDPVIGRWLVRDPALSEWSMNRIQLHGILNLSPYVYCRNNPLNRFDPDGYVDWRAAGKASLRVAGGVGSWALAVKLAGAIGVTVPVTGGASLALGGVSFGLMAWGSSEISFGIADFNIAMQTPYGMRAETYGTLINYLGDSFGVDPIAQELANLAVDIYTGGKNIPKNLYSAEVLKTIEAFTSAGKISEDLIEVLKAIYENENKNDNNRENQNQQQENKREKEKEDEENH